MLPFSKTDKTNELAFYQHIRTDPFLAALATKFMSQDMDNVNLEAFEKDMCKIIANKLRGKKDLDLEQNELEAKFRGYLTSKIKKVFETHDIRKEKDQRALFFLLPAQELVEFLLENTNGLDRTPFDHNLCLSKVIEPLKKSFIFGNKEIPLEAERILSEMNQMNPESIDFPHYRALLKVYGVLPGGRRDTYFRLLYSKLPELYAPKEFPVDTGKLVKLYSSLMKDSVEVNKNIWRKIIWVDFEWFR